MLPTCVLDISNRKSNFEYKYQGQTQIFSEKRNFYKIKKNGMGQFFRGGRGWPNL
jgi:YHS domain-containing protein